MMTAKMVIASAERLMAIRHFWRNNSSTAEIKRTGVANTDPPNEVGDVPGPSDGFIESPHTNARP